ncbi:hypothetical protein EV426DRAFT_661796 [Tirmania nivea]|nr:hypothetical protein EV426DRAFT_661796 [Tirmania nivea]
MQILVYTVHLGIVLGIADANFRVFGINVSTGVSGMKKVNVLRGRYTMKDERYLEWIMLRRVVKQENIFLEEAANRHHLRWDRRGQVKTRNHSGQTPTLHFGSIALVVPLPPSSHGTAVQQQRGHEKKGMQGERRCTRVQYDPPSLHMRGRALAPTAHPDNSQLDTFKRLEYRALKKSQEHTAARAVRTGDANIRRELEVTPPGKSSWHDVMKQTNLAGPIHAAYYLTGVEPEVLSRGREWPRQGAFLEHSPVASGEERGLQARTPKPPKGGPPRSGIETELKDAFATRTARNTAIGWVKSHIGITGNEKAGRRAAYESALGCMAGNDRQQPPRGLEQELIPGGRTNDWNQVTRSTDFFGADMPYSPAPGYARTGAHSKAGYTS